MTSNHINYLPYGKQNITPQDIQAVVDVLRSPFLTQGPIINEFETALAKKVSSNYAVATNSATSALHLACLALDVAEGDIVWTSPITFVASANCALYCRAIIDFVDINLDTGLLCITALRSKLEQAAQQHNLPKVLVVVHLAGSSCDMQAIGALSREYGFSVIEDASHAIGGSYLNRPVGCCDFSQICVFSFHPVKIITTGEGGVATTNHPHLAEKMYALRSHGITKDTSRFVNPSAGPWAYEQQSLGFNYRMTDIQGALGLSQLQRLENIIKKRNELYRNYQNLIVDLPCRLLSIPNNVYSSVHLAVLLFNKISPSKHRTLFKEMRLKGIGVQLHYSPVHLQPYYRNLGFTDGDFPVSEIYAQSSFSIPLYIGLKTGDQKRVIETLAQLIGH